MQKVAIITGGSKGLGKTLVNQFLTQNFTVYNLSRSVSKIINKQLVDIQVDLTKADVATVLIQILRTIDSVNLTEIVLINNAGRLGKIGLAHQLDTWDIQQTIALNLTMPIVLSTTFISFFKTKEIKKTIINISSGAAVKPYVSWATYCTTKAGLDMFSKTIAVEQVQLQNPTKCLVIYPGVVATDMQKQIRNTPIENFAQVARFQALFDNNELLKPTYVASQIYSYYQDDSLENGTIIRVQ